MKNILRASVNFHQLILLVFSLTLFGCGKQSSRNNSKDKNSLDSDYVYIDINTQNSKVISFSELWDRVELIPLETTDESIIQEFGTKIQLSNNNIYLLDTKQSSLLVFDEDGSYKLKIRNIGVGPGEYNLLSDYYLKKANAEINLLNPRGEILIYDSSGAFISKIKLSPEISAANFFDEYDNDTIVIFSIYTEKKINVISLSTRKVISSFYSFDERILNTPIVSVKTSPFFNYKDTLLFFDASDNMVYNVHTKGLTPRYKLDFGKNNFNIQSLEYNKDLRDNVNSLVTSNFVIAVRNYIENDSLVLFRYLQKRKWKTVIYNKRTHTILNIKGFSNGTVFPGVFNFFENGIVAIVEPKDIQLLINPEDLDEEDKRIFDNIQLSDNPLIVKYYLN